MGRRRVARGREGRRPGRLGGALGGRVGGAGWRGGLGGGFGGRTGVGGRWGTDPVADHAQVGRAGGIWCGWCVWSWLCGRRIRESVLVKNYMSGNNDAASLKIKAHVAFVF